MSRGIIGSPTDRCAATKAQPVAVAAAARMVVGATRPWPSSMSAAVPSASVAAPSAAPRTSSRRAWRDEAGTVRAAAIPARIAMGAPTQKAARHLELVARRPPMGGPAAKPARAIPPQTPSARARSAGPG